MVNVLGRQQKIKRLGLLILLLLLPGYFFLMQSLGLNSAPPCFFRTFFGLPCVFCGGTRALRAFFEGRWSDVIYYNPLIFLIMPALLIVLVILVVELLFSKDLFAPIWNWMKSALACPLFITLMFVLLSLFWVWHVHCALTFPKPELLRCKNLVDFMQSGGT